MKSLSIKSKTIALRKIYLIPTTLGENNIDFCIPKDAQEIILKLRCFAVENIKTARRYLRKIDPNFPIDDCTFFELNKRTQREDIDFFIKQITENEIGIISEAGCPGIADPGSELVKIAHEKRWEVSPLVGPSSIFLTLMSSGFNGQEFTFHGYIPKDRKDRIRFLHQIEQKVEKFGSSEIFMETPFRNNHVIEDLLNHLKSTSKLCIGKEVATSNEVVKTKSIADWKKKVPNLQKTPCIFIIGR